MSSKRVTIIEHNVDDLKRIEALEAAWKADRIDKDELRDDNERLKAKLDAVLKCKEVMWKRWDGKYEPYFLKADVLAALQQEKNDENV
jgi:hypothetical protein